ncbi:hypothetical protein BDV25DRAFT_136037 [Aspergillus avenaceus]|uniref:Nucleotide-diphospho-sugar transferase n=1 Tax=Aspergillus avenaceus TaxID=36643 RepID=A0A5N6U6R8_ASPAV|nr:hypothetical protein BDV25DRAFT_136037 [Aspergillus avenaceus]
MAYRRIRIGFIALILLILFSLNSQSLLRLYYLLRLPFVWTSYSTESIITQQDDGFDLTFSAYGTNYTTLNEGISPLIPARIHHIHLGHAPPPKEWISARSDCLRHHDKWEPFLWTDDNAVDFVRAQYPHLYDMWKVYPYEVQRVDALRYMVLLKYGGAVLDYDLACKRALEPLRRFEFVAPAAHPAGFSIGMMLSAPDQAFVKDLVNNLPVYDQVWPFLPYVTVMFSTGCHYASTIMTLQSNRKNVRILSGPPEHPKMHMLNGLVDTPLFHHLGSSSWHGRDVRFIAVFKNLDQRALFVGVLVALGRVIICGLLCCAKRRISWVEDEEHQSLSFAVEERKRA